MSREFCLSIKSNSYVIISTNLPAQFVQPDTASIAAGTSFLDVIQLLKTELMM